MQEGLIDHGQTMGTHMKLVGVGCSIGTVALIVGFAGLCAGLGWCIIGEGLLRLLLGT